MCNCTEEIAKLKERLTAIEKELASLKANRKQSQVKPKFKSESDLLNAINSATSASDLQSIPRVGVAKANKIYNRFNGKPCQSIKELIYAKVGFGRKSIDSLIEPPQAPQATLLFDSESAAAQVTTAQAIAPEPVTDAIVETAPELVTVTTDAFVDSDSAPELVTDAIVETAPELVTVTTDAIVDSDSDSDSDSDKEFTLSDAAIDAIFERFNPPKKYSEVLRLAAEKQFEIERLEANARISYQSAPELVTDAIVETAPEPVIASIDVAVDSNQEITFEGLKSLFFAVQKNKEDLAEKSIADSRLKVMQAAKSILESSLKIGKTLGCPADKNRELAIKEAIKVTGLPIETIAELLETVNTDAIVETKPELTTEDKARLEKQAIAFFSHEIETHVNEGRLLDDVILTADLVSSALSGGKVNGVTIRKYSYNQFCLDDLHYAIGGKNQHKPSTWLHLEHTKELRKVLGGGVTIFCSGRKEEINVCRELVYSYAMWVNPKFNLQVIDTVHKNRDTKVRKETVITDAVTSNVLEGVLLDKESAWETTLEDDKRDVLNAERDLARLKELKKIRERR